MNSMFSVRFLFAVSILVIGIGVYLLVSPGTLARETFSVGNSSYSARLYVSSEGVYAQCTSPEHGSVISRVSSEQAPKGITASIKLDRSKSQIEYWLGSKCVARYDVVRNSMSFVEQSN